ncbi:hypothetical protein VNO78_12192 [Psophocarpus tetragonolobus]|uniref:Uncharacterized protein n=1 Tax=Psophocarpus tetragonolobus TaxID=3891 RepID=A0AAN9XNS2_PSOTE
MEVTTSSSVTLGADDHDLCRRFDMKNHKYSGNDPCHRTCGVVGWCNGLVCLEAFEFTDNSVLYTFLQWNPATRKTYADPHCVLVLPAEGYGSGACGFGYDNLSRAYKLVLINFCLTSPETIETRIDSMFCYIKPVSILENGAVLMIHRTHCRELRQLGRHWTAILYSGTDKTVKHAEISGNTLRKTYKEEQVFTFSPFQSLVIRLPVKSSMTSFPAESCSGMDSRG